jgi:hypothetical protein
VLLSFLATLLVMSPAPTDTTVTISTVKRDLTGDGVPEVLSLRGTGPTIDSLSVTFTIESSGRTLYSTTWIQRRADFGGPRRLSDIEFRARLNEYASEFFEASKFMSPRGFLSWLQASARLHIPLIPDVIAGDMTPNDLPRARMIWEEMQGAGITVFEFSPGGDRVMVIGWSATDEHFYNLLECC